MWIKVSNLARIASVSILMLSCFVAANAAAPVFEIEIINHLFEPSTLHIPANTKVKIIIYNRDNTPEEFESYELNREKVIMGGRKATVFVGPLSPGTYPFFGEFNPHTAQGEIIVEEKSAAK